MTTPIPERMTVHVAELLAETVDLTCEEFYVYQHLTFHLWQRGGRLPDDPARLTAFAHVSREVFDRAWPVVRRFFNATDGTITEQRLILELERARARMASQAEKGRKGGLISGGVRRQCSIPGFEALVKPNSSPGEAEAEAEVKPSSTPRPRAKKDLRRKSGSGSGSPSLRSGGFPLFDRILSDFSEIWSENYGKDYQPTAQDKSHLGRVLATFDNAAEMEAYPWRQSFTNYLRDMDKFVAGTQRHSLSWFCSRGGINKYLVADPTRGHTQREIESAHAGQDWLANGGANGRAR